MPAPEGAGFQFIPIHTGIGLQDHSARVTAGRDDDGMAVSAALDSMTRARMGLRTNRARTAASALTAEARTKTMSQLPVASAITLLIGTSRAAVPLAV